MKPESSPSSSSCLDEDIIQELKADYLTAMTQPLSLPAAFDAKKVKTGHDIIVDMLTSEYGPDDKKDLRWLLDTYWSYIVAKRDINNSSGSQGIPEAYTYIYLTSDRVYVAAFTRKLGDVYINFATPNQKPNCFPGYIERMDEILLWGKDCGNLTEQRKSKLRIIYHIRCAQLGSRESQKMTTELFQKVKAIIEENANEVLSHLILVMATDIVAKTGAVLNECCRQAGFSNTIVLSESFLATYRVFSTMAILANPKQSFSIVVLSHINKQTLIEVYECNVCATCINGIQILSSAVASIGIENIKSAYERATAKISKSKRDSIRYHMTLHGRLPSTNRYFCDELKLKRIDQMDEDSLLEVFAHFRSNLTALKRLLEFSTTLPATNLTSASGQTDVASVEEKFSLEIFTQTGNVHKIWTVKRSKEEFLNNCDQQVSKSSRLNYTTEMFLDDDSLSRYSLMQPDSILQATSSKNTIDENEVPNLDDLQILDKSTSSAKLIGNCIALQNGSEAVEVEDIKQGSLVLARTDLDNLTIGGVLMTCKINGLGDVTYVGVTFRKQLSLGQSGIQIEHVHDEEGDCGKCEGTKSLFIPLEQIGASKDHLFQIE